jgi:mono/diheme cytochrome c family protein
MLAHASKKGSRPMRAIALLSTLLAFAFVASACAGGPDDGDARLAEACARQIDELKEEAGSTPTAKSTEENLAKEQLVECAGQAPAKASEEAAPAKGDETPADEAPATELDPAARELFASTCGSCHTLSDAETTGAVGPNLDETTFDEAAVRAQIKNGGGGMPPMLLDGDEADSVAAYVAAAAAAAK